MQYFKINIKSIAVLQETHIRSLLGKSSRIFSRFILKKNNRNQMTKAEQILTLLAQSIKPQNLLRQY